MVELQKAMANEDAAPEGKSDDKSIEELWEIIRYKMLQISNINLNLRRLCTIILMFYNLQICA